MVEVLKGLRVIEGSAFVAAPLAGMTLAQMGADVIRFDRLEGGLDHHRWPVTEDGTSLFWAGLNKGKRSLAVDMRTPEGQEIITELICAPGEDAGVFLTNVRARGWMDFDELRKRRDDLIMVEMLGTRDEAPAVDYTVNPAVGFPSATGPEGSARPVAHVLPAWDCIMGQKAALAVVAAERHRRIHGEGQHVKIALKDVAAAMLGNLGIIGEATINDTDRPKYGNALYGAYGQDFQTSDGKCVMVIALTKRHWRGLMTATETTDNMDALGQQLGRDLDDEGERFHARQKITDILRQWFARRPASDIIKIMNRNGVMCSMFRSFKEAIAEDPDISTDNPMFSVVDQPGVGSLLTPGTPFDFSAFPRVSPAPAPELGSHTDEILTEVVGLSGKDISRLHDAGIVAGPRKS